MFGELGRLNLEKQNNSWNFHLKSMNWKYQPMILKILTQLVKRICQMLLARKWFKALAFSLDFFYTNFKFKF